MRSALYPLQKALYALISTEVTKSNITEETITTYDNVPPNVEGPLIVLGEFAEGDFSTKTYGMTEIIGTISIWSEYGSMAELQDMADQVIQAVTGTPLDLSSDDFAVPVVILQLNRTTREEDAKYRYGLLQFQFKVEDTS